jgi:hypothetical protein
LRFSKPFEFKEGLRQIDIKYELSIPQEEKAVAACLSKKGVMGRKDDTSALLDCLHH